MAGYLFKCRVTHVIGVSVGASVVPRLPLHAVHDAAPSPAVRADLQLIHRNC